MSQLLPAQTYLSKRAHKLCQIYADLREYPSVDHAANALLLQLLESMPDVLAVQEQWEAVLKEARKKHKPTEQTA